MDEHQTQGTGDYDALAELFLGSGRFAPAGAPAASERNEPRAGLEGGPAPRIARVGSQPVPGVELEAVVLGHLPVRASLWGRQYASAVAERIGAPVGLVRCGSGSVSLDLIGTVARPPVTSDDLLEAIESARPLVARWIVRVDETDEPEATGHPALDRVVVLSGADEAAVVASYRLIKSLAVNWQAGLDDGTGPAIGVSVMGAGEGEAQEAATKIARAVETFLDRPLELATGAGRIGSTASTTLFHGPVERSVREVLDLVSVCGPRPDASGHTLRLAGNEPQRHADLVEPEPTIVVRAGASAAPAAPVNAATTEPAPTEPAPTEPAPAKPIAEREAGVPDADLVATARPLCHVIGGLTRLETRCPRAPGVELAADLGGGLHLVAEGVASLSELEAARAWAREHLPLLLRAEAKLSMPSADPEAADGPAMHLVVHEAAHARGLLDTDVQTYVLRRVRTAVGDGYVAIELN